MSTQERLRGALVEVGAALKGLGRPFALTGGYAVWAHGGPEPRHDVDFLVLPDDVAEVCEGLAGHGLLVRQPAEDWLVKVETNGVTVDLIHRTHQDPPERLIERSIPLSVLSVELPVLDCTDVLAEQLLSLDEHYCDYSEVLASFRALREKVDWPGLADRVDGRPFAEAAVFLAHRLGLLEGAPRTA